MKKYTTYVVAAVTVLGLVVGLFYLQSSNSEPDVVTSTKAPAVIPSKPAVTQETTGFEIAPAVKNTNVDDADATVK
ncbi:MAG: hypothetical protein CME70_19005 [Halobacteriovorax sp.]|nr:hypothetical protein [Halobacteriovorax sp.]|tara:strand:+ start:260 stop:487 length:228 start_codon:yes stop_codon:yes gene_type:complete